MRKVKKFNVDTKNYKAMVINDNADFYSRDTDAFLVFNLTDTEFDFDEAVIYLVNSDDKSVITEIATQKITNGVEYEIEPNIMARYGRWRGQIVFEKDGEKASSAIFEFAINRFLTDERPPTMTEIVSLENLRNDARELIEEFDVAVEEINQFSRTAQEQENIRIANELIRKENNDTFLQIITSILLGNIFASVRWTKVPNPQMRRVEMKNMILEEAQNGSNNQ